MLCGAIIDLIRKSFILIWLINCLKLLVTFWFLITHILLQVVATRRRHCQASCVVSCNSGGGYSTSPLVHHVPSLVIQVVATRRRHCQASCIISCDSGGGYSTSPLSGFMHHLLWFRWWLLDVATVGLHALSLVLQVVATRRRHWFMRRLLWFRWWLLDVATVGLHASSLPASLTAGRETSR